MLNSLKVEKHFPGLEDLGNFGYSMEDFAIDNQLVMKWFSGLQQKFNQWLLKQQQKPLNPLNLQPTGSRSFGASYTESDLECAIVSENFEDFLNFCRFLNNEYSQGHNFIALKTLAGLPLLIIKGENGFSCPELMQIYPDKTLPQFEITFRHPDVHSIIQDVGTNFFTKLSPEVLESYIFNKRYIELMLRNASVDAVFEGELLKKTVLENFKSALSKPLKCLPAGKLQDTPDFNKQVFTEEIKPATVFGDAIASGMIMFKPDNTPSTLSESTLTFTA